MLHDLLQSRLKFLLGLIHRLRMILLLGLQGMNQSINYSSTAACAAAKRAIGTRNGEQLT